MLDGVRMFTRLIGVGLRSQLQYRAAFLIASLGQLLNGGTALVAVWALFARFGSIPGWSFAHVVFFYGFANSSFAVADALGNGFETMGPQLIRTGDFDRLLLRPRDLLLQVVARDVALRRSGRMLIGLAALLWAAQALQLEWSPARAGLLVVAWLCAASLFFAVMVLHATLSFWTVESLEVMHVLSYGGVEMVQYPMTVYARWFRRLFTYFVPFACVGYLPLVAVLGVDDPLGSPRWLQLAGPLAGPLFFAFALAAFKLGVRRYTSTGS